MTMTANGLAKLIEECGELLQVAGKKLAYYHTNEHPDDEGPLDVRLTEEMADVVAAIKFVARNFKLDMYALESRIDSKYDRFRMWHDKTDNNADGVDRPAVNGGSTHE